MHKAMVKNKTAKDFSFAVLHYNKLNVCYTKSIHPHASAGASSAVVSAETSSETSLAAFSAAKAAFLSATFFATASFVFFSASIRNRKSFRARVAVHFFDSLGYSLAHNRLVVNVYYVSNRDINISLYVQVY